MLIADLLNTYTQNILAYSFSDNKPQKEPLPYFEQEVIEKASERIWRLCQSSGRPYILLLGFGCGELPKALLQKMLENELENKAKNELENRLENGPIRRPEAAPSAPSPTLLIADLETKRLQHLESSGKLDFFKNSSAAKNCALLADSSPRAILFILAGLGITPQNTTFYIHPALAKNEDASLRKIMNILQQLTPVCPAKRSAAPSASKAEPCALQGLSILCIMHPDDCGPEDRCLHGFIEALPKNTGELVIVWDSACCFEKNITAPFPVKQCSRPLANDFAAQRNFALSLCRGTWVLALDADEKLPENAWQSVANSISGENAEAFFLPRLTFYPDKHHFRAGFGLWPDLQLRLFKRTKETRFERPIHEILTGVNGNTAFLLHTFIEHYSYLFKDTAALSKRLGKFNNIAGRELHRLNAEYPALPIAWYENFCTLAQTPAFILPQGV